MTLQPLAIFVYSALIPKLVPIKCWEHADVPDDMQARLEDSARVYENIMPGCSPFAAIEALLTDLYTYPHFNQLVHICFPSCNLQILGGSEDYLPITHD